MYIEGTPMSKSHNIALNLTSGISSFSLQSSSSSDVVSLQSPSGSVKGTNTPRRTPEVQVTALPPGYSEGQVEKCKLTSIL